MATAVALAASAAMPMLASSQAPTVSPADYNKYYLGNANPRRNVPPPTTGCTVLGKIYSPVNPGNIGSQFHNQISWDWCQHACAGATVVELDGTAGPCQHFAFFPDGKCYLQGANTSLIDPPNCTEAMPCEHGFPVISGPPDCANNATWAVPPRNSPKLVGEGAECNGSLPPQYATICMTGLYCNAPSGKMGATGTCVKGTQPPLAIPVAAPIQTINVPTPPPLTTLPPVTVAAPKAVVVSTPEPTTITATTTTPAPTTTATTTTTTQEPLPAGAVVVGYYYSPFEMPGTARTVALGGWKECQQLCAANVFCDHFAYWPNDDGCMHQGNNVTLVKATCLLSNATDCPGMHVITGPRNLTDQATWPDLGAVGVAPTAAPTVAPPVVVPLDGTATQVHKSAATPVTPVQAAQGGGGMSPAMLGGIVALVAIVGAVLAFALTQGWFGGEGEEEEDSDIEAADGLGKPLSAGAE